MEPQKQYVSWAEVATMVAQLANDLHDQYDVLLAVTRGGLVPAGLLAYHLGLRNILVAAVQFYTGIGETASAPTFLQFPSDPLLNGRRILIVDDIWDSGKTIAAVSARVAQAGGTAVTAVLHYKPQASKFTTAPNHYVATTDAWIVYPWEPADEQ